MLPLTPKRTKTVDAWCRKQKATALPNYKLGKAIAYSLNHKETFKHVLLDGRLVLSNNLAERAIKTLVMGRKNWLFSQSFAGAQSSAVILSLIETAKRNGLDPEKYLEYLLSNLPNESILTDRERLVRLICHGQKQCRQTADKINLNIYKTTPS